MTQTMSAAAARKASKKTQHVRSTGDWITLILLIVAALLVLFPLLVLTVNAFKTSADYNATGPIIFTIIQSAYGTYLLSSVYGTFPQAILEAAAIDGASRWQILRKVVLPISWSTISVLFVFFFVWTWNEYMIPMAFLMGDDVQTIPLALATLQGQRTMEATTLASASLLSIIPTIIFFIIFQRKLSQGITAGAVK